MRADERSADACPVCGEHRLALLDFPDAHTVGYQPHSELIGMGEARAQTEPAIGCLACGAEWPGIDAFREAQAEAEDDEDRPVER